MEKEIKDAYDSITKKYLPHGAVDIQAGAKETQHIFNNLTASNAEALFLKTLFKFVFSGVPNDDDFQKKLSASGLVHTTNEQRKRFQAYLSFIIAGTVFARSPKDIHYHDGKYGIRKEATAANNYSVRSFVTGALIALFGSLVIGGSTPSTSNSSPEQRSVSEQSERLIQNFSASEDTESPPVKKSKTGICHPEGGTFYEKTKNFIPYDSVDECLASGGRMPRR